MGVKNFRFFVDLCHNNTDDNTFKEFVVNVDIMSYVYFMLENCILNASESTRDNLVSANHLKLDIVADDDDDTTTTKNNTILSNRANCGFEDDSTLQTFFRNASSVCLHSVVENVSRYIKQMAFVVDCVSVYLMIDGIRPFHKLKKNTANRKTKNWSVQRTLFDELISAFEPPPMPFGNVQWLISKSNDKCKQVEGEWKCLSNAVNLTREKTLTYILGNDHDIEVGLMWLNAIGRLDMPHNIMYMPLMSKNKFTLNANLKINDDDRRPPSYLGDRFLCMTLTIATLLFGNDYCDSLLSGTKLQYQNVCEYVTNEISNEKKAKVLNLFDVNDNNMQQVDDHVLDSLSDVIYTFYITPYTMACPKKRHEKNGGNDDDEENAYILFLLKRVLWYLWYMSHVGIIDTATTTKRVSKFMSFCSSYFSYDMAESVPDQIDDIKRRRAMFKLFENPKICNEIIYKIFK